MGLFGINKRTDSLPENQKEKILAKAQDFARKGKYTQVWETLTGGGKYYFDKIWCDAQAESVKQLLLECDDFMDAEEYRNRHSETGRGVHTLRDIQLFWAKEYAKQEKYASAIKYVTGRSAEEFAKRWENYRYAEVSGLREEWEKCLKEQEISNAKQALQKAEEHYTKGLYLHSVQKNSVEEMKCAASYIDKLKDVEFADGNLNPAKRAAVWLFHLMGEKNEALTPEEIEAIYKIERLAISLGNKPDEIKYRRLGMLLREGFMGMQPKPALWEKFRNKAFDTGKALGSVLYVLDKEEDIARNQFLSMIESAEYEWGNDYLSAAWLGLAYQKYLKNDDSDISEALKYVEMNEAARAVVPELPELAGKARKNDCKAINTLASLFSENKELNRSHPVLKALGEIFAGYLNRLQEQGYSLNQTSADRFGVKLKNLTIGTIGYRNAGAPSLGIVIANTLHALLGTGEKVSSNAEDHMKETKTSKWSWSYICVNYETENRRYTHIDFTNPVDASKGMMLTEFDGMILVVDAQNGCTDDWIEQLRLAKATGVANIVVFVDHSDLVEDTKLNLLSNQIQELLDECGYCGEEVPILYGSINHAQEEPDSEWGEKILNLVEAMEEYVPEAELLSDKPFLMPVEDIYEINGRGIVATGMVETGIIKINDKVEIVGFGADKEIAVVTGIEMFRKLLDFAEPLDNIGLMLRGIAKEDLKSGQVIANVGTCKSAKKFAAVLHYLSEDALEFLKNDVKLNFMLRTAVIPGKISFSEEQINKEGQYAGVAVELSESVAVNPAQFFYIYDDCKNLLAIGKVK